MTRLLLELALLLAAGVAALPPPIHPRPLVGILAQPPSVFAAPPPAPPRAACQPPQVVGSYIAASYVKFMEAGGARAVPIRYDAPPAELRRLFGAVNALLLPGGAAEVAGDASAYRRAGELLFDWAVAANARGDHFAVHGTCLGWEQLAVLAARNASALSVPPFAARNGGAPLAWAPAAAQSRLFGGAALAPLRAALQAAPAAYESHTAGVTPQAFATFPGLAATFDVLSLSYDEDGREYVSTAEGRSLPLTATQWHPEKALFEWNSGLAIPRGGPAAAAALHLATFLGREARRSRHAPANAAEEAAMLIDNHCAVFTGAAALSPSLEQLAARRNASNPVALPAQEGDWARFDSVYMFPPWGDDA